MKIDSAFRALTRSFIRRSAVAIGFITYLMTCNPAMASRPNATIEELAERGILGPAPTVIEPERAETPKPIDPQQVKRNLDKIFAERPGWHGPWESTRIWRRLDPILRGCEWFVPAYHPCTYTLPPRLLETVRSDCQGMAKLSQTVIDSCRTSASCRADYSIVWVAVLGFRECSSNTSLALLRAFSENRWIPQNLSVDAVAILSERTGTTKPLGEMLTTHALDSSYPWRLLNKISGTGDRRLLPYVQTFIKESRGGWNEDAIALAKSMESPERCYYVRTADRSEATYICAYRCFGSEDAVAIESPIICPYDLEAKAILSWDALRFVR